MVGTVLSKSLLVFLMVQSVPVGIFPFDGLRTSTDGLIAKLQWPALRDGPLT